ncbi:MAG: hypothetical protein OXT09_06390, partial [Myxococcales bacterium]|nr:hypothetical protein [Myxococcales bacterium]
SAAVEAIAGVEVAHGGAERPSGEVGVTATALHGGLAYSPVRSDGLALQLGAELGIGYLRLSGDPRDDFAGDSVDGLTLELGLQAGPRIRLGDAVATLLARAGWLFGGAEGLVVQGRPVEPAGPWLATTLELSLDI